MRWLLGLLILALLWALPSLVAAEECVFDTSVTWTAVNQDIDSTDCTETGADSFTIPDGVTVTLGGNILQNSGGGLHLTVQSGGTLTAMARTDSYNLRLGDVGLDCEPGSTCTFGPAFRTLRVDGGSVEYEPTDDNLWPLGDMVFCPDVSDVADCDGEDDQELCFIYTTAKWRATASQTVTQAYVNDSIATINADIDFMWMEGGGAEGFAFDITSIRTTGDRRFCIDLEGVDYDDTGGFTRAEHHVSQGGLTTALTKGDRTVVVECDDDDDPDVSCLLDDGANYDGWWLWFGDANGVITDEPYQIYSATHASDDATYLLVDPEGVRRAYATTAEVFVWYLPLSEADPMRIMAPIKIASGSAGVTDSAIELSGTTNVSGIYFENIEGIDVDAGSLEGALRVYVRGGGNGSDSGGRFHISPGFAGSSVRLALVGDEPTEGDAGLMIEDCDDCDISVTCLFIGFDCINLIGSSDRTVANERVNILWADSRFHSEHGASEADSSSSLVSMTQGFGQSYTLTNGICVDCKDATSAGSLFRQGNVWDLCADDSTVWCGANWGGLDDLACPIGGDCTDNNGGQTTVNSMVIRNLGLISSVMGFKDDYGHRIFNLLVVNGRPKDDSTTESPLPIVVDRAVVRDSDWTGQQGMLCTEQGPPDIWRNIFFHDVTVSNVSSILCDTGPGDSWFNVGFLDIYAEGTPNTGVSLNEPPVYIQNVTWAATAAWAADLGQAFSIGGDYSASILDGFVTQGMAASTDADPSAMLLASSGYNFAQAVRDMPFCYLNNGKDVPGPGQNEIPVGSIASAALEFHDLERGRIDLTAESQCAGWGTHEAGINRGNAVLRKLKLNPEHTGPLRPVDGVGRRAGPRASP